MYDTLKGVRGEVHILIKVELIRDLNRHRDTSTGVPIFYTQQLPPTYTTLAILGFVEELMLKDDPECVARPNRLPARR